jgi:SAM-dependent methyltransferase
MRKIVNGKLKDVISGILGRLQKQYNIEYPEGYENVLFDKYYGGTDEDGKDNVKINYLGPLMRLGKLRMEKFGENYKRAVSACKHGGKILDYGAGFGEFGVLLDKEGCLKKNVFMYDVDWECIDVGFDFLLGKMSKDDFIVCDPKEVSNDLRLVGKMDFVFSRSVLHSIYDSKQLREYLENSYDFLKDSGTFFGVTLAKHETQSSFNYSRNLLSDDELKDMLTRVGFRDIGIEFSSKIVHDTEDMIYPSFAFSARK